MSTGRQGARLTRCKRQELKLSARGAVLVLSLGTTQQVTPTRTLALPCPSRQPQCVTSHSLTLPHTPSYSLLSPGSPVLLLPAGRWDEAAADYQAVLAVAPDDPVPWNNLGNTYMGEARWLGGGCAGMIS